MPKEYRKTRKQQLIEEKEKADQEYRKIREHAVLVGNHVGDLKRSIVDENERIISWICENISLQDRQEIADFVVNKMAKYGGEEAQDMMWEFAGMLECRGTVEIEK